MGSDSLILYGIILLPVVIFMIYRNFKNPYREEIKKEQKDKRESKKKFHSKIVKAITVKVLFIRKNYHYIAIGYFAFVIMMTIKEKIGHHKFKVRFHPISWKKLLDKIPEILLVSLICAVAFLIFIPAKDLEED